MDEKVILLNGFSTEEAIAVMRAVKALVQDPADIAFAMATETNLHWTVSELIELVAEEHRYMKANPPGSTPPGGR
jgi:hypothetical protein